MGSNVYFNPELHSSRIFSLTFLLTFSHQSRCKIWKQLPETNNERVNCLYIISSRCEVADSLKRRCAMIVDWKVSSFWEKIFFPLIEWKTKTWVPSSIQRKLVPEMNTVKVKVIGFLLITSSMMCLFAHENIHAGTLCPISLKTKMCLDLTFDPHTMGWSLLSASLVVLSWNSHPDTIFFF